MEHVYCRDLQNALKKVRPVPKKLRRLISCRFWAFFTIFVTNFVLGGSVQDDFLLELQNRFRAGQISAGAGRLTYFNVSAAE